MNEGARAHPLSAERRRLREFLRNTSLAATESLGITDSVLAEINTPYSAEPLAAPIDEDAPPGPPEQGFTFTQASEICGVSLRQLDYWTRTALIRPTLRRSPGGMGSGYSYRDLLEIKIIKNLIGAGIKLESVREVFEYLRANVDSDISKAHIVVTGSQVLLVDGEQLVDVVSQGQGVLNVLPLAGVKGEVDAAIRELREVGVRSPRNKPASETQVG